MKQENVKKVFIVRNADRSSIIRHDDILYCTADGSYCTIHTIDGEIILLSKTLATVNRMLSSSHIVRISQSNLVNAHYVKYILFKNKEIELVNGNRLHFTVPAKQIEELVTNAFKPQLKTAKL